MGPFEDVLLLDLLVHWLHGQTLLWTSFSADTAASAISSGNLDCEFGFLLLGAENSGITSVWLVFKSLWDVLALLGLLINNVRSACRVWA